MIKRKLIFLLISFFFLLGVTITVSYAWYTNIKKGEFQSPEISGYSIAAYFAGGKGTALEPYKIANPTHFYNLAWLQYLGEFNKAEDNAIKQTYFELTADIDCSGLVLPPIGTTQYPFVGNFNGNSKTIKNYSISNLIDSSNITKKPSTVNADASGYLPNATIVGTFGVVGNYNSLYKNSTDTTSTSTNPTFVQANNVVKNFYLDNCNIKSAGSTLVGLAIGYVGQAGTVSNIGVHYSSFNLSANTTRLSGKEFISKYSLVGDYDSTSVGWEDKQESGGAGYGRSMDLQKVYEVVTAKNGGTKLEDKQVIPFKATDESYTTAASDNMGFFIGGEINTYTKTTANLDKNNFYYPAGASNSVYTLPHKDNSGNVIYPAPSQNIIDATVNSGSDSFYCLRLQAKLDVNNQLVTIENTYVNGEKVSKLIVPRRCIWFKPKLAGNLEFVMVNPGNGENFTLTKIERTGNNSNIYERSMSIKGAPLIETNNMGILSKGSSNINVNGSWTSLAYTDLAYFFSIEVTPEDIEAGYEYCLSRDNGSNGAYFWYLDIGTDGGSSSTKPSGTLSSIDFVYSTGGVLSVISSNNNSGVLFKIDIVENTTATVTTIYFKRKVEAELNAVLYCMISSGGYSINNIGTGTATTTTDINCDSVTNGS